MTDAPERIYLQDCGEDDCEEPFSAHHEVTWCEDRIHERDVAYMRADKYDALAERVDAAERENATLREIINLVLNIPRMTDAQLAELVANCKIALAAPSAPKEPTR